MSRQKRIIRSALVALQLVTLLSMELYFLLPIYRNISVSRGHGVVCYHNHRLCGCSPERIANHTCCCAQFERSAPACCAQKHFETKCAAQPVPPRATRFICAAPCGGLQESMAVSHETMNFEPYFTVQATPPVFFSPRQAMSRYATWSSEPLKPPPKLSIFS
jgi:hypothetical protein